MASTGTLYRPPTREHATHHILRSRRSGAGAAGSALAVATQAKVHTTTNSEQDRHHAEIRVLRLHRSSSPCNCSSALDRPSEQAVAILLPREANCANGASIVIPDARRERPRTSGVSFVLLARQTRGTSCAARGLGPPAPAQRNGTLLACNRMRSVQPLKQTCTWRPVPRRL